MKIAAFILLALSLALCDGCDPTTYNHARCQDLNTYYSIYWSVEGEDLSLALVLKTNQNGVSYQNGWIGFGISVNGGMRGADIAVARQVNGNYVLEDRFVPGEEGMPKLDVTQNLVLISATSDSTATVIKYKRKLTSCDVDEDVPILADGTQVIFAWGRGEFGYHGQNRGATTLHFHYVPVELPLPTDAVSLKLQMPNYTMPGKDTTYTCTPLALPHDHKYQIVRWRPIITPGNEPYIHHIVLFGCPYQPPSNVTEECGMAPSGCLSVLVAWSVGQDGNDWLGDYAFPFGAGGVQSVYLQIHYNNPGLVNNVVDSSGIELIYTAQLRKYDMGMIFLVGNMKTLNIPPQSTTYSQTAECLADCSGLLTQSVTMVGYFPHMHQIGKKIWVQHIRNGTELQEVHRDDHYDFQRQQNYLINRTLMPGDRLIVNCVWDSMSRAVNTTWGESSSDEMCVAMLQFYPRIDLHMKCSDIGMPYSSRSQYYCEDPNYTPLPVPVSTCNIPTTTATTTARTSADVSSATVEHRAILLMVALFAVTFML